MSKQIKFSNLLVTIAISLAGIFPFVALAQVGITNVATAITAIEMGITRVIPILILIALLFFIISAVQFVFKSGAGGDAKGEKARMLFGIIGLFVILSIWGILGVISRTLGTQAGGLFQSAYIEISTNYLT